MKQEPILVSIDLETSGTILGASPILAIGACRATHDWEAEWDQLGPIIDSAAATVGPMVKDDLFYVELSPPDTRIWITQAVRFHKLKKAHLEERGTHPFDALRAFLDWLYALGGGPDSGATYRLVSHNASFDWAHLCSHLNHYALPEPFDPFPACTKNIARGRFHDEVAEHGDYWSGQTKLASVLGMPKHHGKHNALADALSQAVLYNKLTEPSEESD
jgi:DNA polymerase III epsilon subunit-like protein